MLLVLGFLFHLFKKGASETKKKITDHMLLKVAPAVIFVVAVFGYFLCKAPYDIYSEEHGRSEQALKRSADLEAERDRLRTDKAQLQVDLDAARKAHRAITRGVSENYPTTDSLAATKNEERRCWISNHFGLANSTVKGAVTATAVIIRCTYRIEAPYLVHVEFDREILPGGTVLPDIAGFTGSSPQTKGKVYEMQVLTPSLPSQQLVIVTVYGTTDQYPRAVRGEIKSIE